MRMRNRHHQHGPSLFSSIGQALNFNFHPAAAKDEVYSIDPQAAKFDLKVAERLAALELALAPTKKSFTLGWIDDALLVVTAIISEAQSIIPEIQRPLTESDELWVSGYLEDTCRLLDVLNTLRKSVGDLEHRLMLLHLAVSALESKHGTQQDRHAKARKALGEFACPDGCSSSGDTVKSCCGVLREMLEQRPCARRDLFTNQHRGQQHQQQQQSFLSALYAAKVVAVLVLGTVLSLFSRGASALDWSVPIDFAWSDRLRALLQLARSSLQVKVTNFSPLLDDFAALELEVANLKAHLDSGKLGDTNLDAKEDAKAGQDLDAKDELDVAKVGEDLEAGSAQTESWDGGVGKLKDVLKSVEDGVDRVRQDTDKLFHVIVGNRNSLLSCLRGSDS